MKRSQYSIAILGAGIGAEHLDGLRQLTRAYRVAWICDLDQARAEALAATCGAQVTTDMTTVFTDPEVDIVDVCLPPSLHVPVTLQALAAGKHVICEKPIAASLRDVDRIEAAADAVGRQVFPVFQYRYGISTRTLDSLIKGNLLGPLRMATLETHWNRGADYYAVPWRGTVSYEMGGAVLSHAIHIHDLICKIAGPIARVSATTTTAINPIETEDCAAIWMQAKSGALITSSITLGGATDHTRLRLVFEKATIETGTAPYGPAAQTWTYQARIPADQACIDAAIDGEMLKPGPHLNGFAGYFATVAAALDGRHDMVGLADGRRSIELASAIYASASCGRAVSLPMDPAHSFYDGWATTEPA